MIPPVVSALLAFVAALFRSRAATPGTSRASAPARGLSTNRPSPAAPPARSSVLGMALTLLDRLANSTRLCPAPHDPRLATSALSRPLATAEPARHARPSHDCQRHPRSHPHDVARPIRPGVHHESSGNCRRWVSTWRNPQARSTDCDHASPPHRRGRRFSRTTSTT